MGKLTWVNGNCSELAPHLQTLCSMTRMAKRRWAIQAGDSQESPSSGEMCEWTRCRRSSKHSAASPRQPRGKRLPAKGPLAKARRKGSGHKAGSELVCNCWNSSWRRRKKRELEIEEFIIFIPLNEWNVPFIKIKSWHCKCWLKTHNMVCKSWDKFVFL